MKKFICLTLLLGSISAGFAQKVKKPSALQAMVDTERAFARMSEEQGTRPSFMAFIADDGILFRPTAVKGKQWLMENPVPPSEKRPLLSWQPTFADMARAGDLGYTFGPWEFKADIHDSKPVGFGHFLTVWKKQADGLWKFAIDIGITHPQPAEPAVAWQPPKNYRTPKWMKGFWTFSAAALLARDREFSTAAATRGTPMAFDAHAAESVRVFRNDKQPFFGKTLAAAALPESPIVWIWEPAFADVSASDDLGYSYGTYQLSKNDATQKAEKVETGNYLRIWKKQNKAWQVVVDLLNPLPAPAKN